MTGVSLVSDVSMPRLGLDSYGPVSRSSYAAECTCGWRTATTDEARTREIRELGEQHSEVCLG